MVMVALSALGASGCVHVRNSLYNTVADATDIFRADVSASFGTDMGAHVMATQLVQLKSYSYEDLYRAGIGTRCVGLWKEDRQDWWIGPWCPGGADVRAETAWVWAPAAPAKMRSGRHAILGWVHESPDEVGVGVHAFVLGARVGARPLEFLDFLVSPVGLDLCNDNLTWAERRAIREARRRASALRP